MERGECSFEQKAINAMHQYPALSYMVVYDYKVTKNLVAMRETQSGDGINLGMLFVSNNAGMSTLFAICVFVCHVKLCE